MITLEQAMQERHSVRSYQDKPLDAEVKKRLRAEIRRCNQAGGLHIQLVTDEPEAFDSFLAHYGKFSGVKNYIAMIGKKSADLEEKCGYYGEKLVLAAQQLGLNTCWVAMTYKKVKTAFEVKSGEKLCIVIAIGYGQTQGVAHKSKEIGAVTKVIGNMPDWFRKGAEAALLAPTAMNQQKFVFSLDGGRVTAKAGTGFYTKIDLGIAKYHFELGAGRTQFTEGSSLCRAGLRKKPLPCDAERLRLLVEKKPCFLYGSCTGSGVLVLSASAKNMGKTI